MHVAIGHYVSFTGLAGRFSDLQAGSSMGLVYLLSGFVMALGYGQKAVRPSHWLRLRQVLLRLLRRGLLLPPFCVSRADAAADAPIFAGRRFYECILFRGRLRGVAKSTLGVALVKPSQHHAIRTNFFCSARTAPTETTTGRRGSLTRMYYVL
ncbi:hypothetical protein EMIHUDRAFT_207824 [Emiliania huxleyi CCMP1516]|uniref:Uncharacterized protein n=2 Tax=Emiliania huxleyi TaxID=2903 RepID=A0A0D3JE25_EMIH1|nr:hypothetical protein EMIHUDRAFT_207824 [Emiliania huxleyi CCMP1516]EOD21760.1 hypothetical protein EMIHUDRAFT_207824 [Emiliania huxleyi CCMP1516]|eukprot:XP_005774189.1 hypothetical protein EMIHUDRAFT_207824 [Emiliania huxleyi CCMP1516]